MITMVNLIDAHGGCVERFSGDGILAMFGVPIRRETDDEIRADAVAAVRCARAMAEAIGKLNADYRAGGQTEIKFAVGIQSGELVSCSLGSNDRQQYTTMGDTTNTAARLVGVAKDEMKLPGFAGSCCIVIGGATRLLVGDAFGLRPLGPVDLKGKARRTTCFALDDGRAAFDAADAFASAPKYGSVTGD
jgi:adenylate cyclase